MNAEELLELMLRTKTDLRKLKAVIRAVLDKKEETLPVKLSLARAFRTLHEAEIVVEELRDIMQNEKGELN